jgi:hypothetical protein
MLDCIQNEFQYIRKISLKHAPKCSFPLKVTNSLRKSVEVAATMKESRVEEKNSIFAKQAPKVSDSYESCHYIQSMFTYGVQTFSTRFFYMFKTILLQGNITYTLPHYSALPSI